MEQGFAAVCREQIPGSKVGRGRGEGAIVYLGSLRSREPRNSIATNSGRGYYSAVKFYFASIYWPAFAKPDLSLSPYAPVYLITTNYCYEKKRRPLRALPRSCSPPLLSATSNTATTRLHHRRTRGKRGLKARGGSREGGGRLWA